jgi:hypothetical protein
MTGGLTYERFKSKCAGSAHYTPVSDETIKRYKNILPEDLLIFWQELGFGSYMDGYLRITDPVNYDALMKQTYNVTTEPVAVIGITAFADLIIWEKDVVKLLNYRLASTKIIATNFKSLFNFKLPDESFIKMAMKGELYPEAKEKLGIPESDECYGYFPALVAGGSEKVENLERVKSIEHIGLLHQLAGSLE